jgi:hypothetical protein
MSQMNADKKTTKSLRHEVNRLLSVLGAFVVHPNLRLSATSADKFDEGQHLNDAALGEYFWRSSIMRPIIAIACVFLAVSQILAAEASSPDASGVESLGSELLEDLSPEAFDSPSPPLGENNKPTSKRNNGPGAIRFDDLGEDISQPSGPLSLARVRTGMRDAATLLGIPQATSDVPTLEQAGAAQQQVITQLDELIAELSKQCQGGQCNSGGGSPKPEDSAQKKPGSKPGAATGRGQTAARESSNRLGTGSAKPGIEGDVESTVKQLWGHLPERSREQMMQSFSEEFLPKYEAEIEEYYRRLSEEDSIRQK